MHSIRARPAVLGTSESVGLGKRDESAMTIRRVPRTAAIGWLGWLGVFGMVIGACSPVDRGPRFRPAGNPTPRDGGTLRFAITEQVRTLDPTIGNDDISYSISHLLFDT